MLPHARPGSVAGLLELLQDHGGREDLYHVTEELLMEVDDLLPVVEAAELLDLARSDHGDVEITAAGKTIVESDIPARRELFRQAALAHVTLLQQINSALASKSDHAMPLEFFRDVLEEHFSAQEAQRQLETALHWGRYAELFLRLRKRPLGAAGTCRSEGKRRRNKKLKAWPRIYTDQHR